MKVISWNIACIPDIWNLFGPPEYRLECIVEEINKINPDIICLQEVFSEKSRNYLCKKFGDKYEIRISPEEKKWYVLNGGLFIASKYPIINCNFYIFKDAGKEDRFSEKGFIHIIVEKSKNKRVSILNTHLNASTWFDIFPDNSQKIRIKQIYDILSYIDQIPIEYYNMICGDFNDNYNSKIIKQLFKSLKIKNKYVYKNNKKIVTCEGKQLDYIIMYGNKRLKFKYEIYSSQILSDHKILKCIFI